MADQIFEANNNNYESADDNVPQGNGSDDVILDPVSTARGVYYDVE